MARHCEPVATAAAAPGCDALKHSPCATGLKEIAAFMLPEGRLGARSGCWERVRVSGVERKGGFGRQTAILRLYVARLRTGYVNGNSTPAASWRVRRRRLASTMLPTLAATSKSRN